MNMKKKRSFGEKLWAALIVLLAVGVPVWFFVIALISESALVWVILFLYVSFVWLAVRRCE